ncbi:hypothetical protein CHL76_14080 [Marinococcus halophilus]|uniref:Uncharacterized protein n=1 Tax=Marinococcus halophilus TaxID=1371 RepID=A0A510Y902_MARHA|nr:hypothetical protein [Marinococcus halophilus]OZT79168.1 hypothetical protein CHL76_14080 [Marinococcus halophilus]GEK59829.1 hypothetical protein MHA01_27340 [Marinococcus halophilus]
MKQKCFLALKTMRGGEQQEGREINIISPGDTVTAAGMDMAVDSADISSSEENADSEMKALLKVILSETNQNGESKTLSQEETSYFALCAYSVGSLFFMRLESG